MTEGQAIEDEPARAESNTPPAVTETSSSISSVRDGSLGIGSLKGDIPHE